MMDVDDLLLVFAGVVVVVAVGIIGIKLGVVDFTTPVIKNTPTPTLHNEEGIASFGDGFYQVFLNTTPISCVDLFFKKHDASTHKIVNVGDRGTDCYIDYYFKTRITYLPLRVDQEPTWEDVWVLNSETINKQNLTKRIMIVETNNSAGTVKMHGEY